VCGGKAEAGMCGRKVAGSSIRSGGIASPQQHRVRLPMPHGEQKSEQAQGGAVNTMHVGNIMRQRQVMPEEVRFAPRRRSTHMRRRAGILCWQNVARPLLRDARKR